MKNRFTIVTLTLLLCSVLASGAQAQLKTEGQAFGSSLELVGEPAFSTSDTEPQMAEAPGQFDVTSGPDTLVPAAPLAEVFSGESTTTSVADDGAVANQSFVTSTAGDVVARVLLEQASGEDVIAAATNGATVTVSCDDDQFGTVDGISGTSSLELLKIAGMDIIAQPGTVEPNTVLLIPGVIPIIVLNEQRFEPLPQGGRFTVNAVNAQLVTDAELLRLILSSATGAILDVPEETECDLVPPPPFFNSLKLAELLEDENGNGQADPGDTLRFTIRAENSSDAVQTMVRVVDRLPSELDVDETSVMLDGAPLVATIGECPEDANFQLCQQEPSEECLVADIGDVGPGETRELTFDAVILSGAVNEQNRGTNCNTALIADVERSVNTSLGSGFDNPPLNPTGDRLRTTGSGGCAIGAAGSGTGLDAWPLLLLSTLVALRRLRKRPS